MTFSVREYDTEEIEELIRRANSVESVQVVAKSGWFKMVLSLQLALLMARINRLRLKAVREHVERLWDYKK